MTTATTQTLAAFLLARIEEDEAAARAAIGALGDWDHWAAVGNDAITTRRYDIGAFIFQQSPARVLAECEARRAIVQECAEVVTARWITDRVLTHFAAPYASHPDFDPAWRA